MKYRSGEAAMDKEVQGAAGRKRNGADLTEGRLWDKILFFAMPIVLMNILQQLFNTADIAVVGRLVGNDALAAVGSAGPIVTLFITVFSGLSVGANAVIARMVGSGNKEQMEKSVHTSVAIAVLSGAIVLIVGEAIARPLLELVGTPENVMDMAVLYLRIYFSGSIFIMLYNFEAAILRAAGDTRRPLYVLLISGVLNIALNLFFVMACDRSVDGVALATLVSNIVSAVMLFGILVNEKGGLWLRVSEIRLHPGIARGILLVGIPAAIQGMLFNIANIVLQSGINSLGPTVVAGNTVGVNVEIFLYFIVAGFGQACITFNGQNLGAGKLKRCVSATRWCLGLGFILTVIASGIVFIFRNSLAGIFTQDNAVIRIAAFRIAILATFEVLNMMIEVISGALRGWGHSFLPAFLCLFFVCGVRMVWLFVIFPMDRTYEWLMSVYPASWILAVASLTGAYFYVKRKLFQEMLQIGQSQVS